MTKKERRLKMCLRLSFRRAHRSRRMAFRVAQAMRQMVSYSDEGAAYEKLKDDYIHLAYKSDPYVFFVALVENGMITGDACSFVGKHFNLGRREMQEIFDKYNLAMEVPK